MLSDVDLLVNCITLFAVFFVGIFLITNPFVNKRADKLYKLLLVNVLVELFFFDAELYTVPLDHPTMWRVFFSIMGYSLRPTILLIILLISLRKVDMRKYRWIYVPAILNFLIMCSAFFSKLVFYYNENNVFRRGPLGYLPHAIALIYILMLLVFTILKRDEEEEFESAVLIVFSILVIMSMVSDAVVVTTGLLRIALSMGIMFYYIYFATLMYRVDPLTGAYNRMCFFRNCDRFDRKIAAAISLDLNNLKEINDKQGHLAGDAALSKVVECIKKELFKGTNIYRVGGDEFIILIYWGAESKTQELVNKLKESLTFAGYSCAIGYCVRCAGMTLEKLISEADKNMYKDKEEYKTGRVR